MTAVFKRAAPYADDAMNLPVGDVDSAVSFYETVMGFTVASRSDEPLKSATLSRDDVQIAIVENGGDPSQEGCFFEVDNVEAARAELQSNGLNQQPDFRTEKHGETTYRLFFIVAPDGLCYCIGEVQVSRLEELTNELPPE